MELGRSHLPSLHHTPAPLPQVTSSKLSLSLPPSLSYIFFCHSHRWTVSFFSIFCLVDDVLGSGIPMLERSADQKFKSEKNAQKWGSFTVSEYLEYKRKTSPLIPLPTTLYGALPNFIRILFFFEFPFYDFDATSETEALSS